MELVLLEEFYTKTGDDKEETAFGYLQAYDWNVEVAIMAYTEDVRKGAVVNRRCLIIIAHCVASINIFILVIALERRFAAKKLVQNCLLPDFSLFTFGQRLALLNDLIDEGSMSLLEEANRLNWWCWHLGVHSK